MPDTPMSDTLVLLPGLLNDAELYVHQRQGLADLVDTILIPDLTRAETMEDLAREVLAQAPDRFALAGLSMGGYVAQEVFRQAPERIERLALMDTSARPDSPEQRRRRTGLIELSEKGRFKGVTPRLLPMLINPSRMEDQPLVDSIFAMASRIGQAGFVRQQRAILSRADSRELLRTVSVPTLIMVGDSDQLTPPELAEEMAGLIAGAELIVVKECGHLPVLEHPKLATTALREWLGA